jgi:predicted permease
MRESWYSEGSDHSIFAYLRCVRRQPNLRWALPLALVVTVAATLRSGNALPWVFLAAAILAGWVVGYVVWRRLVERPR